MRTDQEIFDQTNELARDLYAILGYVTNKGYRFDTATHPQEQMCWRMACEAQLKLTDTDMLNVLDNLEQ